MSSRRPTGLSIWGRRAGRGEGESWPRERRNKLLTPKPAIQDNFSSVFCAKRDESNGFNWFQKSSRFAQPISVGLAASSARILPVAGLPKYVSCASRQSGRGECLQCCCASV